MPDMRQSGIIRDIDGAAVAQIDLIHNEQDQHESVRLYTPKGFLLAEMDYQGSEETGYQLGLALYRGYVAGRDKREYELRIFMEQALRQKGDFAV
ncbi:MAG: hypothetical protein IIX10_04145 [Clostridia bacterium]|nr:hypothetical protein [Clostridia bacterium]